MPEVENIAVENIEVQNTGKKFVPAIIGVALCAVGGFVAKKVFAAFKARKNGEDNPDDETDGLAATDTEDTAK